MEGEFYSTKPPAAIERLARIEGESNFNSMLMGVEAGRDTTQDMAGLAMSRRWVGHPFGPELLETHVSQSTMFRLPIMTVVFRAILAEGKIRESDYPWIQGAIADAFALIRVGWCKTLGNRARSFHVDISAYSATRKLAHGVMLGILDRAETEWKNARFGYGNKERKSENTGKWHSGFGIRERNYGPASETERRAIGSYTARPFFSAESDSIQPLDTRGIGIKDNLGWNDRNAAPGPVTITPAQPTANLAEHSPNMRDCIAAPEPAGT